MGVGVEDEGESRLEIMARASGSLKPAGGGLVWWCSTVEGRRRVMGVYEGCVPVR